MARDQKPERLQLTAEHLAAMDAAMQALEARYEEIMARVAETALPTPEQELTVVDDSDAQSPRRWLTRDGQAQAQAYVDARAQAQAELRELTAQSARLLEQMTRIDQILGQQVLADALRAHAVLDRAGLAGDLEVPAELSGEVVAFPGKPRKT